MGAMGRIGLVTALAGAGVAAVVLARRSAVSPARRTGLSAGGMAYALVGDGPRTVMIMPGGPGSMLPSGPMAMALTEDWEHYLAAGYRVCFVTRPRNMPMGHSIADMAADHARFIRDELGGRVDLAVGKSYGGLIAFYLAANHREVARFVVAAGAAATIPEAAKTVDRRWAQLRAEGRHTEAAAVMLEFMMPGTRAAFVRRLAAPVVGALFATLKVPAGDVLVEAEAEWAFDAPDMLTHLRRIQVPMLLVYGEEDEYIPRSAFEETAAHIPDCTVVSYPGLGHRAVMSSRVPKDVLAWISRRESASATATAGRPTAGV